MRLDAELHYPADPAAVLAMLTDPEFQRQRCADGHARSAEVEVGREGGVVRVVVRQVQATDTFPPFVQSFVGATLTVVETSVWQTPGADGSVEGTVSVEISGAPVALRAVTRLSPGAQPGTTTQLLGGELKASVPFVGAKIEQAAEPAIRAAVGVQERTARGWLSRP